MKKIETTTDLALHLTGKEEHFTLYADIANLYGGWLLETNGDPIALAALEEAADEESIAKINAILADANTPWEACSAEDEEYVSGWLANWGIVEA